MVNCFSAWSDDEGSATQPERVSAASDRLRKLIEQHRKKKSERQMSSKVASSEVETENRICKSSAADYDVKNEWEYDGLSLSEDETKGENSFVDFSGTITPLVNFDTMKSVKSMDWVYSRQKKEHVEDCDFCPRIICAALNSNTAVRLWIGLENCKNESSKPQWAPLDAVEINFGALFGKLYLSGKVSPKLPEGVVSIQNVIHSSKEYDEFLEMKKLSELSVSNIHQFCLVAKVSVCPNAESNVTLYKFERKIFFLDHLKKHLVFFNSGKNMAEIGRHLAEKSVNYYLDMLSGARWARESSKNSFL